MNDQFAIPLGHFVRFLVNSGICRWIRFWRVRLRLASHLFFPNEMAGQTLIRQTIIGSSLFHPDSHVFRKLILTTVAKPMHRISATVQLTFMSLGHRCRWLVFASLLMCLCSILGKGASLCAQQKDRPRLLQENELPDQAIWRYGEFGKTSRFAGIYRLAFSPDGKLLAARNQEMEIQILDVATHEVLCQIEGHEQTIQTIDFSPDSKLLVTAAGENESVKIWEARSGKLVSMINTVANAAFFSASGNKINVLGGTELEVYSFPGNQRRSRKKWRLSNERVEGMSHDGRLIVMYQAINNNASRTMLMDTETRSRVTLPAPTTRPRSHAFSPDRNWLAMSFGRDPKIYMWDLRAPHARVYQLTAHSDAVQTLAFSADGRFLLSGAWDDTHVLWEVASRKPIRVSDAHTENVNATAFGPDGFRFATGASGNSDQSIIFWGFENDIRVKVAQPARSVDDVWDGLASKDFDVGIQEVNRIANEADTWLPQLRARVEAKTEAETSGTVDGLVKLLNSPKFKVRENAMLQLIKIRLQSDSQIRAALENAKSPEIKYRLRKVLAYKVTRPEHNDLEERQWMRFILALELAGSQDSEAMLKRISKGHENVDYARAAADALVRLEKVKGTEE